MYRRANQSHLMDPLAAIKLLQLWVWIPPEVLQSSVTVDGRRYNLKELSFPRFKYRKEFWSPVIRNFNRGTAEGNHNLAQELCLNLFMRTFYSPKLGRDVTGLVFDTNWYYGHYELAKAFFQTLQTRKVERTKLTWTWHECVLGNESTIKIFDINCK